jgi:hypothetical protein
MSSVASKIGDRAAGFLGKSNNAPKAPSYNVPASLPQTKKSFLPPPVRRGSESHSTASPTPPPVAPRQPPTPEPEPEEEEVKGEWAEALYDYHSEVGILIPLITNWLLTPSFL